MRTKISAAVFLFSVAISFKRALGFQKLSFYRRGGSGDIRPFQASVVTEVEVDESDDDAAPSKRRFMYMTKEQDEELRQKGHREAELMSRKRQSPLKASKAKGGSGGFGKTSSASNNSEPTGSFKAQAKSYAKVLAREGLVRIDNVLPGSLADNLKEYLVDLRARATADIENGVIEDSQLRFADVLLNQNRCDLKIPLGPSQVNDALEHILSKTVVRDLIEYVFDSYGRNGSDATLYELNCFMSNTGARRQLVHADNACMPEGGGLAKDEPIMLTCFIALQDIDETMGPTIFIPRTHNVEAHNLFYENDGQSSEDGDESTKDRLLRSSKTLVGTLPKGSCAIFDPRILHCAGANNCPDSSKTRALFYFSFKNPVIDHPGCPSCSGYGVAEADLTMHEVCDGLAAAKSDAGSSRLDALACFPYNDGST